MPKPEDALPVKIERKEMDMDGIPRVVVGGGLQTGGVYCGYRCSKEQAITLLEVALGSMRLMAADLIDQEPAITPDRKLVV